MDIIESVDSFVFFDTETTGLPDWKNPSDSESQPHIVQLAAIKCDAATRKPVASIDLIIKPDGWVIPEETTAIHGITTEHAERVGVPEDAAVSMLLHLCEDSTRVAHNRTFDQRIVRIALKRSFNFDEAQMLEWADKENFDCSMYMARAIMGGKIPKLTEAHKYFTGEDFEDAHSAMSDAAACMRLYWAIQDYQGGGGLPVTGGLA